MSISEWILVFCLLWLLKLLCFPHWWGCRWIEQRVLCFSTNYDRLCMVFTLMHFMYDSFWHLPSLIDWVILKESSLWIPVVFTMTPCFFLFIAVMVIVFSNNRYWNIDMLSCIGDWFIVDVSFGMLDWLVINVSQCVLNWFEFSVSSVVGMAIFWVIVMRTLVMVVSDVSIKRCHNCLMMF